MREIRQSGSEGGGNESNRFSLPLLRERTLISMVEVHDASNYFTASNAGDTDKPKIFLTHFRNTAVIFVTEGS
jgi:hypothetical protein